MEAALMQSFEATDQLQSVEADAPSKLTAQQVFDRTSIETMPIEQFVKIPINTKQRDTELRAKKLADAGGGHLATLQPEHLIFSIVRDKAGNEMKLDGHTRTFMYEQGWYELPSHVYVLVINVDDITEGADRYDSYDSPSALKTSANTMQSAYRVNGFHPITKWVREARGVKSALSWAHSFNLGQVGQPAKLDAVHLVHHYIDELRFIDSLSAESKIFPAQYLAASIAILHKFKEEAHPFFEKYKNREESVSNSEQNSIHIINAFMKSELYIKLKERKSASPSSKFTMPAAVFVNAFLQWYSNPEADWSKGANMKFDAIKNDLIVD